MLGIKCYYRFKYILRKFSPAHLIFKIRKRVRVAQIRGRSDMRSVIGNAHEYEKIKLKKVEFPKVSIVIPVYNQFAYTYNCILSILRNTSDIAYEIIIADDNSEDLTKCIEEYFENINVVRMQENIQFLLNCNAASQKARAEYIFFLNNDTQILDGCINQMVKLLDDDKSIGMVGAKLIYPNGLLQEAGGIVWKDGSASNYGNRENPDDSAFNYLKEVDYVSGAAIMVRKKLWDEIGGFDTRYVPAYYEDTDLAFEIRKRGFRVVYQPEAEVVHFEGVSNGVNLFSGSKENQIINEKKFYKKWSLDLKNNNFKYGASELYARDRSINKKHIMVVHSFAKMDTNERNSCLSFLIGLAEHGLQILVWTIDTCYDGLMVKELQQSGIEVKGDPWRLLDYYSLYKYYDLILQVGDNIFKSKKSNILRFDSFKNISLHDINVEKSVI